ncbi:MAG: glucans biosynthesis glucosyltransferase MdoH, partial [Beijerinckiaceae bacterium]|nr:glucans biosynthesis glucosyltransferase MdoH [Beijerinckiaceae bacterium]
MALSMDAVTYPQQSEPAVTQLRPVEGARVPDTIVSTPPEAPLAMPAQNLSEFDPAGRHKNIAAHDAGLCWAARILVFGGGLALTIYGGHEMYRVVDVGGVTPLEWALLLLFIANFSWIALACTGTLAGFIWLLFFAPKRPLIPGSLRHRTAVVMPVYNETPSRVFGAVAAMVEEVEASGFGRAFDWFFLSDTTDPEIFIAEEQAYLAMREKLGPDCRLYYRHRPKNRNRKSGNIEDFVTRWGGRYEHMVVMDADSLMAGQTIVALAAAMEADPDSGIIQTLPLIVNRNTLFARLQQFAARIYGPVIAAGVAVTMGRDGNYWGHNAVIRTKAFAARCGLPELRGRPPLGGHILSHDFVEAALMRRSGYAVYMLPNLGGSYEECPPSLIDLATRDRRWCQGNLQHSRLLAAKGLHPMSRQHLMSGIMSYAASPLWMAQLMVGIVIVLQASYIRPEYFPSDFTLFPAWPRFDP